MATTPRLDLQASSIWSMKLKELRDGLIQYDRIAQDFEHIFSYFSITRWQTLRQWASARRVPRTRTSTTPVRILRQQSSAAKRGSIKQMNEGPRKANPLLAPWQLAQLRCVPCEEGTFRTINEDVRSCVLVRDDTVVVLDEVDLQ